MPIRARAHQLFPTRSWTLLPTLGKLSPMRHRCFLKVLPLAMLMVTLATSLALMGCDKFIGNKSGSCKAGTTCDCDGIGNCLQKCDGADCKFKCGGMGNCTFECPGGQCTVTNEATGNLQLSCEGGGCKVDSTGTGNVIVDCGGGSCTLDCSGTSNCQIKSCKAGCKVNCTGTGTCDCKSGCD